MELKITIGITPELAEAIKTLSAAMSASVVPNIIDSMAKAVKSPAYASGGRVVPWDDNLDAKNHE